LPASYKVPLFLIKPNYCIPPPSPLPDAFSRRAVLALASPYCQIPGEPRLALVRRASPVSVELPDMTKSQGQHPKIAGSPSLPVLEQGDTGLRVPATCPVDLGEVSANRGGQAKRRS